MGLASWLGFEPKSPAPPQVFWQQQIDVSTIVDGLLAQPIDQLWREQPHLRTVVGFIARNIAHLGLHVYQRDSADGRNRVRTGPLATLLEQPNAHTTSYELIYATVASMCLYDEAYWYVTMDSAAPSGWSVRHIPSPWMLGTIGKSAFAVEKYKIALPNNNGKWVEVDAGDMLVFHGWSPSDPTTGTSPIHALKAILAEQVSAQVYRNQMWMRGGRVGSYLTRPPGVEWSDDARKRFTEQWSASYAGDNAPKAGGTPLLEDGMELKRIGFSAKDDQYIEAAKLSLETVAQVYHINPTMVGLLDNANYSNVREFRRMLYGDTLGPWLAQLEQLINGRLVPRLAPAETYVEFNLQAKLAGSFEEQGAILQQAIGGPYMTRNEGRAALNMPAVTGGDELIVPLNVTANGSQDPIPAEEPVQPTEEPKHNGRTHRGLHVRA